MFFSARSLETSLAACMAEKTEQDKGKAVEIDEDGVLPSLESRLEGLEQRCSAP